MNDVNANSLRPAEPTSNLSLSDQVPAMDDFRSAVTAGLTATPKTLPTRFLYDQRGSSLFDEICRQPEYYLTRCELEIMKQYSAEMAHALGPRALVVEYGSGASQKTRKLLDHLEQPAAYVPLDISREFLLESAEGIVRSFPDVEVLPLAADFTKPFVLPEPNQRARRTVVYFPGSTIGNFTPGQACKMLNRIVQVIGHNGGLLIGIDLRKDESILRQAYNDHAGVTRRFILNILVRMQRELKAAINVNAFHYLGVWNDDESRVEMTLISDRDQTIRLNELLFPVARGEKIVVEYSYKYDDNSFTQLATRAGLVRKLHWTDPQGLFRVEYLEPAGGAGDA